MSSINDFPSLGQLFEAYFHQDWCDEFESPEEAVAAFQSGESIDVVSRAKQELDLLTASYSDESSLADAIGHLGCYYNPVADGLTYREWLIGLKSVL